MKKYILGILKNIFNPAISFLVRIDNKSVISRHSRVYMHSRVTNSTMSDYSYVGRYSNLTHADVGKFCSIGGGVLLGMGKHTLDKLSTSPIFTEKHNGTRNSWVKNSTVYPFQRVKVGNDVWIGTRAMIMGGVTIGDGAIIGAGAIVTKDVPPYAIVAGVPAKIIRYRYSADVIDILEKIQWWNNNPDFLKQHLDLFQCDNICVSDLMSVFGDIR